MRTAAPSTTGKVTSPLRTAALAGLHVPWLAATVISCGTVTTTRTRAVPRQFHTLRGMRIACAFPFGLPPAAPGPLLRSAPGVISKSSSVFVACTSCTPTAFPSEAERTLILSAEYPTFAGQYHVLGK